MWVFWGIGLVGAVVALVFALRFYRWMMRASEGEEKMREIARNVREGANAYLRRQYRVVALFFVFIFLVLAGLAFGLRVQALWVPFAFLTGGFFSGLCGYLGMKTATYASGRTTNAAKESLNSGLQVAFRSGAVMGLVVVGFGLLDITLWFLVLYKLVPVLHEWFPQVALFRPLTLVEITVTMLCFGVGASTQALFARVGGGIFTKAADVGADLVGKVEAGIPEDDPRNPATIADNVGDNVGDVAGMGADLYESYCGSILASAALGVAAAARQAPGDVGLQVRFVFCPMAIAGIGILLSILGIYLVRSGEKATQKVLLRALARGVNASAVLIALFSGLVIYLLLPPENMGVWGSIVAGLVAGWLIGKWTEYSTSAEFKPTRGIAEQSKTGPATVIIAGMSQGMLSTWAPVSIVVLAILISFGVAGGFASAPLGLYGIGVAAVGMLATLGITLATDAYGPIADNAGGNAEMSGQEPYVRERTDALDALGNTTAATGKGFAIGSAALTALALLASYVEEVRNGMRFMARDAAPAAVEVQDYGYAGDHVYYEKVAGKEAYEGVHAYVDVSRHLEVEDPASGAMVPLARLAQEAPPESPQVSKAIRSQIAEGDLKSANDLTLANFMEFYNITLMSPRVIGGMLVGSMLAFAFCALTMKAVGRAAGAMVEEVRRQFKEIPGLLEGTAKADYASCVHISTRGAQREMILPSMLALAVPVGVGLVLGVGGVMGLLASGLATGFVLAVMMANAGGAWDNAKKYIEGGALGGKGSDNHKATVVGDTVGDPFKDTSGPSLNILIKLMAMVSVVFAGLVVKFAPVIEAWLGM
ncbi:MAG: sodium-translocating pyrophosphatase [Candidatus Brocadiia bacterium]